MDPPPELEPGSGLEHARALPPQHYLGEASLETDLARVFARSWQLVARRDQLAGNGDHVVSSIGRTPLLVLRNANGQLRALANVCRHRARPLALQDGRGARSLRCRYHGWNYDLDGRLRRAPEMQGAAEFRIEEIRLPSFRVDDWQGLVFVALEDTAPPLAEVLEGIAERIAPTDLATLEFAHRDRYSIACNWKVYVDNYLEGYHLPSVHPGLSRVLDYRAYRTELFRWHSLQHSPLRPNDNVYGDGQAYYYFVYPNMMLNVMPDRLQVNRVLPEGPARCTVEFDYYYAPQAEARSRAARDRDFSEQIQQEDIAICEAVQHGLASGQYEAGRLCPARESGLWHFHRLLLADYKRDVTDPCETQV